MSDQSSIRRIEIEGLHGQQSIALDLRPGLNIVYGRNGSGKTSLLHILANLCDGEIERFLSIQFARIHVATSAGSAIDLVRDLPGSAVSVYIDKALTETISEQKPTTSAALTRLLAQHLGGRPVYLPAFRSVLDAANDRTSDYQTRSELSDSEQREIARIREKESERAQVQSRPARSRIWSIDRDRAHQIGLKTIMCRRWFGQFVPVIRYPSLTDVVRELASELDQAYYRLSRTDQEALNTIVSGVLETVLTRKGSPPEEAVDSLLLRVKEYLQTLDEAQGTTGEQYAQIAELVGGTPQVAASEAMAKSILNVYADALGKRADQGRRAFSEIRKFEDSVNQFLENKQLQIKREGDDRRPPVKLWMQATDRTARLTVLSSGERQVLTLLFSATHMLSSDGIVLIDEPELSLHTGWQRRILGELTKQAGGRQIIACTHAPAVAGKHRDCLLELNPQAWQPAGSLFSVSETDGQAEAEQ